MARLRIGDIVGSTPPRLRIGGIVGSGAEPTTSRLRIGGIVGSGALAVVLAPIPSQSGVDPLSPLSITAALATGSATPASYSWRVVSGTPVTLTASGPTVTFRAPASSTVGLGASVVIGVRGVLGAVLQPEQQFQIDTRAPQFWELLAGQLVAIQSPLVAV